LDSTKELLVPGGRIYEQRECICNALESIPGLTFVRPKAAFYIFPKLDKERFGMVDDEQFAFDLLREKHILLTHGGGFHWEEPDHFRIVYLPDCSVLTEATDKLRDFLADYHQGGQR
jgi:alanine-synthesizing transaminase